MTSICFAEYLTFVDKDAAEKLVKVPIGMSMLEAPHENDIELEGHLLLLKALFILFLVLL